MIERWKKQKLRMLDLEPAGPFADAALAQDDDLLAAPQRIHHDGPFVESNPHGQRLNAQNSFGNLPSGCCAHTLENNGPRTTNNAADLDTTTTSAGDSLSPRRRSGERGRGDFKGARQFDESSPSPQSSPRSCLAGRGSRGLQRWWVYQEGAPNNAQTRSLLATAVFFP